MAGIAGRFRFAYSSNAYTRASLDRAVESIAAEGFEGIEILADVPHVDPTRISPAQTAALRARLREAGLAVSNVNANTNRALSRRDPEGFWPDLLDPDPDVRRRRCDYIRRAIEFAAEIGSPSVAISLGRQRRGEPGERLRARLEGALAPVLRRAEAFRMRIGIEYEPGHFIQDSVGLAGLLARLDHPLLGVNLDIGHTVCAGETIADAVRRLRGRIWNVHVEDIRGRRHVHLIPGRGEIDFGGMFRALAEADYRGFLTLELYPYRSRPAWAGREGLRFLRRVLAGLTRRAGTASSRRRGRAS